MLQIDQRVINIIRKLRKAVENEELKMENFPVEDIISIVDNTVGDSFWKCIGSKPQDAFVMVGKKYEELFTQCKEQRDKKGCVILLDLLENHYRCFHISLSNEELIHREKNYRIVILNIGHALAKIQYWLHEQRQNGWSGDSDFFEKGKGAVYTCMFGGAKELYQPEYTNVFWDYICFTNDEKKWGTKQGIWEFRKPENPEGLGNAPLYYNCKIRPYTVLAEYDYSIWIEPQMQIVGELEKFYKIYGKKASFLAFSSYAGDSMYDVVNTSLTEDDSNIEYRKKMFKYHKEGFPEHFGLINSNLMIRNHGDEELRQTMELWWQEANECKSIRDFAFNYVAWKRDFKFAICDLFVENNSYIRNRGLELEVEITE